MGKGFCGLEIRTECFIAETGFNLWCLLLFVAKLGARLLCCILNAQMKSIYSLDLTQLDGRVDVVAFCAKAKEWASGFSQFLKVPELSFTSLLCTFEAFIFCFPFSKTDQPISANHWPRLQPGKHVSAPSCSGSHRVHPTYHTQKWTHLELWIPVPPHQGQSIQHLPGSQRPCF